MELFFLSMKLYLHESDLFNIELFLHLCVNKICTYTELN